MPTYRNDGIVSCRVVGIDGIPVDVTPGRTIETYSLLSESFMTQVEVVPYWNPFKGVDTLVGSIGEDAAVVIDSNTKSIRILNFSGVTITVYFSSVANIPGLPMINGSIFEFKESDFVGKTNILVFTFSGVVNTGATVIQSIGG